MTQTPLENTAQITLDNFHEIVKGIHTKDEALEVLKWTNNFLRETFEQANNNAEVLNIVESSLAIVRRLDLSDGFHHLNLINRLGLMCHLNGNYNQAISLAKIKFSKNSSLIDSASRISIFLILFDPLKWCSIDFP